MEIGNKKYLFVIHEAKLNGKCHVVFKVSTKEIKLSEKKMLKLPCGHHDGVRFDIDDGDSVSLIIGLEFNGNPTVVTKPGLPPDISYPTLVAFDLIYPTDDASNIPSSIVYVDTSSLNGIVNPSSIQTIKILDIYDGPVEYMGLQYLGTNVYQAKYKLPDTITNSYFKSTLYPNSKFKDRIIPITPQYTPFRYNIGSDITFVSRQPLYYNILPPNPVYLYMDELISRLFSKIDVILTNISITNNTCGAIYVYKSGRGGRDSYIMIERTGQFILTATQNKNQLSTVVIIY